ncbi:MAG: hypothetical protein IPN17_38720 [Deltaproteobacteria bacterium]|nr:hypothetical protein [Deltaproteobacteria bacterium]
MIGTFNPAIFQPEWFRLNEILPSSEVEAAVEQGSGLMLTPEIAAIKFKSLQLSVFQNRWSLSTSRPDWEADLGAIVTSIFALLPHTPVTTLGFNVNEQRPIDTAKLRSVLNHWVPLSELSALAGEKSRVGGVAKGTWKQYQMTLRVDESAKQPGTLEIQRNFERQLTGGVKELKQIITTDWATLLLRAKEIGDLVLSPEAKHALSE